MLPSVASTALESGELIRADGTPIALRSNVSGDEATRLYNLVRARNPNATIELGLAQGISALAITQALKDNEAGALHHIVDPFQSTRYESVGLTSLDRAGLREHVRFHEAFPEEAVPTLPRAGFAFIDASHVYDFTVLDFVLVDKRLEVGGLIGFHDLWMKPVLKAVRFILTNRAYRIYDDVPPPPVSAGKKRRSQVAAVARRVPYADRVLRPEVLRPAHELGIHRSMIFIEKTGEDERDWRSYDEF
jgi:predicted O-methyltransferase YrrM